MNGSAGHDSIGTGLKPKRISTSLDVAVPVRTAPAHAQMWKALTKRYESSGLLTLLIFRAQEIKAKG